MPCLMGTCTCTSVWHSWWCTYMIMDKYALERASDKNTTWVFSISPALGIFYNMSLFLSAPTTSVSSTYSTYLPLPSHLPTSSTADSSKVERMQWLVPIVCSIAAALFVATVTLLCLVFILWRMKGKRYMQLEERCFDQSVSTSTMTSSWVI